MVKGISSSNKQAREPWKSFYAWDFFAIQGRDEQPKVARRLNLKSMSETEQKNLRTWLETLGIEYSVASASHASVTVSPGDKALRVFDPESLVKLDQLFYDAPKEKDDWRNLFRWDKKILEDGFILGNKWVATGERLALCWNVERMDAKARKQLEDTLKQWNVKYGIRSASVATQNIKVGEEYLRVSGVSEIEKLERYTSPWMKRYPLRINEMRGK